jgi:hypothetical protein
MIPLYRAGIPPSVLYIVDIVAHMPGSLAPCFPRAANEADWMDNRVRTISRGYVKNTEVMPAAPPQTRRLKELISPPGEDSKNCRHKLSAIGLPGYGPRLGEWAKQASEILAKAHLFVEIVTTKLHCRIWHNSNAIGPVSPHKSAPALLFPHLHETFANWQLVFFSSHTLYLEENLKSFEGWHNCPRNSSCHPSRAKCRYHRLCDHLSDLEDFGAIFGLEDITFGLVKGHQRSALTWVDSPER